MTCIVGIEHEGDVWIGGDSAGVSNLDVVVRAEEKVFETNGTLFGFTTSFRMGQIIRYSLKMPVQNGEASDIEFLCTTFIDSLRGAFVANAWSKNAGGRYEGGQMLLAYRRRLYTVDTDFQVYRSLDGHSAVGCGSSYALGSLHTTSRVLDIADDPFERCIWALEASAHGNAGVRAPFVVLSTRKQPLFDVGDTPVDLTDT